MTPIGLGTDGFYHPANEEDVVGLIQFARANGRQVRARGATHSVSWSIYSDPVDGVPPNQTLQQMPPDSDGINIAFDQMRRLDWVDENRGIVEAEPGINLGRDPSDPFGISTLDNSFLYQAFLKGWAVDILGGITHQTVAGFSATGSAGGSTKFAWDNVIAFRVVDGTGKAEWVEKGDPAFDAMATSMGLLGIVTKLRFQLVPMYNIEGTESTTEITGPNAPMDLFGPGAEGHPSLEDYLKQTPYTRIVWWPQKGAERIQTWQAKRIPASNQNLTPYEQFTPDFGGQTKQLAASMFFIVLGNSSMRTIERLLWSKVRHYFRNLSDLAKCDSKGWIVCLPTYLAASVVSLAILALGFLFGVIKGSARKLFPKLLPLFNPITKPGKETRFSDYYWRSLCMDNTVDDVFLGTEFTEIWVPIKYARKVMQLYQKMFEQDGVSATGFFSTEVYGGPPSSAWMHPGYSDGSDDYSQGTCRFDVYWYRDNAGAPNVDEGFFEQYWEILIENDIPFRLHWGKFIPRFDFETWAKHYRDNLPRFDDFMALRSKRDPDDLFFTEYWRLRLTGSA